MKAIILIIGFFLGIGSHAQTQEEQLKAHGWYVYKVVLEEAVYITPNNEEWHDFGANLGFSDNDEIWLHTCWTSGLNSVLIINDETFTAEGWVSFTLNYCSNQENILFNQQHDNVLLYKDQNLLFNYVINELDNNVKELVVTNELGNQAYYYSSYLSSESHIFEEAKIYPNPAQSFVNISLPTSEYQNLTINLYDISGKKLKTFTEQWQENIHLDIEELPTGNYLLEFNLSENTGRGYVVKLIKE